MSPRLKYWVAAAAITIAAAAGAQLLSTLRLFQFVASKAYDAHFVLRGKLPIENIVLVGADQKALDTFPEPQLFWHPYYAEAIQGAQLGGAKVVGIDHAFGIPVDRWAKDNDDLIANAVATAQVPVVVGFIPALNTKAQERPIKVNMLAAALGLFGYANLTTDPDDFIRRQELIEAPDPKAPPDTPLVRSFALRIAEKALDNEVQVQNGRLQLAGKEVPIDDQRSIRINFAGPPETFPRVSMADFVAASKAGNVEQLKKWVSGKVVLIGPDALDDRYPTPYFSRSGGTKWTTPGFEIHASTLRTILTGSYILPAPKWVEVGILLALSLATFLAALATRTSIVAISAVASLGVALAGSHALFVSRYIVSDSDIAGSWLLSLLGAIVYRFVSAENRRDLFRKAVKLFVGDQVATTLDTSTSISRSGKREDSVTILFSDIRGFTAFCEDKDPAFVVDLLNQYLSQMVGIIVNYGGHVNKFIGDGILAVFSPNDGHGPDHAERAVRCAMRMVTAPNDFNTGTGIHTGPAVVGNIGSEDKLEFTVLGDTVNLASRLESLNKEHKTSVLLSAHTREAIKGDIGMTRLGAVEVRGKSEPVEIFTVTSLVGNYEARKNAMAAKGAK